MKTYTVCAAAQLQFQVVDDDLPVLLRRITAAPGCIARLDFRETVIITTRELTSQNRDMLMFMGRNEWCNRSVPAAARR